MVMRRFFLVGGIALAVLALFALAYTSRDLDASSHREAPLISNDPLADNCDLWAFRSPEDDDYITIVATYVPLELPEGGPNYSTFGENIRYEIHIKNKTSVGPLGSATDDITYRFTFSQTNEDGDTFFNIRLGQNLKTTYKCEKIIGGNEPGAEIISNGVVPPNNIGPRSTSFAGAANYDALVAAAINTSSPDGEKVFCGPRDDAFFVDLGGIFDLGQTRNQFGADPSNALNARDAVAGFNTHAIVMNIPITELQKDGLSPEQSEFGPFDPTFVIGVWASASRPQMTTLSPLGAKPQVSGNWVQVSRLGMPLTNEAIIPIKDKDYWNAVTPYSVDEQNFVKYFANPELALYMDDSQFGTLVPALSALRVQKNSYPDIGIIPGYTEAGFDFRNTKDGAFAAAFIPGIDFTGTAIAVPTGPKADGVPIQTALVAPGEPRRADIFPIFYFGVPNIPPYQLATGKTGGPLSPGKSFINNFLPITNDNDVLYGGDMLRLNMATPVTDRTSSEFQNNARMGLIRAAVLGLTDPAYANTDTVPHMDGFPNGRRLEDDVTTIELQAVGGLVLAAVGLPFDDATAGDYSDLASAKLVAELTYNAGPTANDLPLLSSFPYLATPHEGYSYVKQLTAQAPVGTSVAGRGLGIGPNSFKLSQNYPNPFNPETTIEYDLKKNSRVVISIYNTLGQKVATVFDGEKPAGQHRLVWDGRNDKGVKLATGTYIYQMESDGVTQSKKMLLLK